MRGCKFFNGPGGGYCRPTNTGIIEENCVLYQDRCLTPPEYTRRTGNPPPSRVTEATVPPGPVPAAIAASTIRPTAQAVRQGLEFISGPVSWYFFEFGGRRFHLFGDAHFSKSNNCPDLFGQECTTVTPSGEIITRNQLCYDITYLLKELFDRSKRETTYTDFFMEIPFKGPAVTEQINELDQAIQSGGPLTKKQQRNVEKLGYIGTLYLIFGQCFQHSKEACPYRPYVRFHYVDVRLTGRPEEAESITLNTYLFADTIQTVLALMGIYYTLAQFNLDLPQIRQLRQEIQDRVELINTLIDRVLLRGRTLEGTTINYNAELFNAALLSDNYPAEIDRIFDKLLAGLPTQSKAYRDLLQLKERMKMPVTQRQGHSVHRVRAQLDALRNDNVTYHGENMADLITRYIQERYEQSNLTQAYNRWRQFYTQVYLPFTRIVTTIDLERAIVGYQQFQNSERNFDWTYLIASDAVFMDAYLLARMFRRFTTPRQGRGIHVESTQIITYTGAEHTQTYAQFFREVLRIQPIDSVITPLEPERRHIRCLRDRRFSQDFGDL